MKCSNCRRDTERLICDSCWQFAIEQLKTFPQRYGELESELLPSRGYGQRVSGTRTPPLPVRLETLHLRSGGISRPLMQHETSIRIELQHTKITFRGDELGRITKSVEYLTAQEEWIYKNYVDADRLTESIIHISNQIKYVLGWKSDEILIGVCPTMDTDGNACGTPLRVNIKILESGGNITCKRCKTTWEDERWRFLGKVLESEEQIQAEPVTRQARSRWTI